MKYLAILYLFLLGCLFESNAQKCEDFVVGTVSSGEYIIITKERKIDRRGDNYLDELKETMKKDLQVAMSECISVQVNGMSDHAVSEKNGEFSEYFNSQLKVETSTTLGFAWIDFCVDRKERILYGKYKLSRKELADVLMKYAVSQLTALNAEIQGKVYAESKIDVQPLQQRYTKLARDYYNALYLDPSVDQGKWNLLLEAYNFQKGALSNSQDQLDFNRDFSNAKELLKNSNYYDGIRALNKLKIEYDDNQDLNRTLQSAFENYRDFVVRNSGTLESNSEYLAALELINKYCSIADCNDEIERKRFKLKEAYFESEVEKFEMALKFGETEKVNKHKENLDRFSDVSPGSYKDVCEQHEAYNRKIGLKKALSESNKGNYWAAYYQLQNLENSYGKRDGELSSFKSKLEQKIFRMEVAQEKKKRQHTFSFWLGTDVFFNRTLIQDVFDYSLQSVMFSYSGGLYWKYRFEGSNNRKPYPVNSDFLGVKFRVLDFQSNQAIVADPQNIDRSVLTEKVGYEVGLDGFALRVLHYGLAMGINQSMDFNDPQYYSATLGFRIPISVVSWTTDLNLSTALEGKGYVFLSTGLHLRLDFNRKFGRSDKRKIRAELFD
jgi:hypothetical protein